MTSTSKSLLRVPLAPLDGSAVTISSTSGLKSIKFYEGAGATPFWTRFNDLDGQTYRVDALPVTITGEGTAYNRVSTEPPPGLRDLVVASGEAYANVERTLAATDADPDSTVELYIDRTYQFDTLPTDLDGLTYIQTANDDKQVSSDPLITFTLSAPARVYILHDDRITTKPSWLSTDFTNSGTLATSPQAGTFEVYFRDYPSGGAVSLGPNGGITGSSMYVVAVGRILEFAPPPPPPGEIGNLFVASGEPYVIAEDYFESETDVEDRREHIDQPWEPRWIPDYLRGLTYIRTAHADKNEWDFNDTDNPFISFDTGSALRIYIVQTERVSPKPAWLSSWMQTNESVISEKDSSDNRRVFFKDFTTATTVKLGGNVTQAQADAAQVFMYYVLFGPIPAPSTVQATRSTEIWRRAELDAIPGSSLPGNWNETVFSATFTHTVSGTTISVPGYYAGLRPGSPNGLFRIGFMPTETGKWNYVFSSAEASIDGIFGTVYAAPSTVSGLSKLVADGKKWQLSGGEHQGVPTILRTDFFLEDGTDAQFASVASFLKNNNLLALDTRLHKGSGEQVITNITFDWSTYKTVAPGSDNWPLTWAEDGHQYTSWGDGGGFGGTNTDGRVSLGFGRIEGDYPNFTGINVWGGKTPENPATFEGKSASILCLNGNLYAWHSPASDQGSFDYKQIIKSSDKGASWIENEFPNSRLTGAVGAPGLPYFINYGQNYGENTDGFVYIFTIRISDTETWEVQKPGVIWLARASATAEAFTDTANWEWLTSSAPSWGPIQDRVPVIQDADGFMRGSCFYNPGLDRFVMAQNHTARNFGNISFYEAPNPWGPWNLIFKKNNWPSAETQVVDPTFAFGNFSPKWLSTDGRDGVFVWFRPDAWNSVECRFVVDSTSGSSFSDHANHVFDQTLWTQMQRRMELLSDQGRGASIMLYGDQPNEPPWGSNSATENLFIRYAVARLCGYPIIVWDTGLDISSIRDQAGVDHIVDRIKSLDPYNHLISSKHTDTAPDNLIAANQTCVSRGDNPALIGDIKTIWSGASLPVGMFAGYGEDLLVDPDGTSLDANQMRRMAWKCLIAGGAGLLMTGSDGFFHIADISTDMESEAYLKLIQPFVENKLTSAIFADMGQSDSLVSGASANAHCSADPARERILYWTPGAFGPDAGDGGSFTAVLTGETGTWSGIWFNPRDGTETSIGDLAGGSNHVLTPPSAPVNGDWVALLTKIDEGEPPPPPPSGDVWFVENFEEFGSPGYTLPAPGESVADPEATAEFQTEIQAAQKWRGHFPNHWQFAEIRRDSVFGKIWRQNLALRDPEKCQPGGGTGLVMKLPVEGFGGEGSLPRPEPQEIWVETFVRVSPNYITDWENDPRSDPTLRFAQVYTIATGDGATANYSGTLDPAGIGQPLWPNSLVITATSGGLPLTVTDNGSGGLTGDGTGTINYDSGAFNVTLSGNADNGTSVTANYETKNDCGAGSHKFHFFDRRFGSTTSSWRYEQATQGVFAKIKGAGNSDANQYKFNQPFLRLGDPTTEFPLPNPCFNGKWLRFRYHLRAATAHGVSDGHFEWRWVEFDDPDVTFINTCAGNNEVMAYLGETPFEAHEGWTGFQMGITYNAGPYDPVYFEFGEIRVWKKNNDGSGDPGWGW